MAAVALACAPAHGRQDAAPPSPAPAATLGAEQEPTIEHLSPRRDSSGPIPKRLEWTPVKGADNYSVGVWSEVDYMVWKVGHLKTSSVDWPADIVVEPGTYFWSVMAFRGDRPIADSGRAAFIVVR
jgi:hypothetical protein